MKKPNAASSQYGRAEDMKPRPVCLQVCVSWNLLSPDSAVHLQTLGTWRCFTCTAPRNRRGTGWSLCFELRLDPASAWLVRSSVLFLRSRTLDRVAFKRYKQPPYYPHFDKGTNKSWGNQLTYNHASCYCWMAKANKNMKSLWHSPPSWLNSQPGSQPATQSSPSLSG